MENKNTIELTDEELEWVRDVFEGWYAHNHRLIREKRNKTPAYMAIRWDLIKSILSKLQEKE